MQLSATIDKAAKYILDRTDGKQVNIGLILGSGLGVLGDKLIDALHIPYADIPGFPVSTVEGHAGKLVVGALEGRQVMLLQGRFHYYEGYAMEEVVFPVRVMQQLGVKQLIVTNAAGAVNIDFRPGDLVLITDHINYGFVNPLIGPNIPDLGPRFPDTSRAYTPSLGQKAKTIAGSLSIPLQEGTYLFATGPSYETPAEVRAARLLGADVVGMSTVPEVLTATHMGMEVLGISCVTNMAAGILEQPLSHEEVIETTQRIKEKFSSLVKGIVRAL